MHRKSGFNVNPGAIGNILDIWGFHKIGHWCWLQHGVQIMTHKLFLSLNPVPLHRVQGSPSDALPVPVHLLQIISPVLELLPLPPQTMQVTLAPSGFFPVPEQKTHSL
jgi:hypothetical protein